jgi:NAD(P)-dependent dehydrogenase (short-subunit alcohol dehydrogenase family)
MAQSRPSLSRSGSSIMAATKVISLVTGGNAGIGYEIVKQLAQNPDHQVLMGCRDTSKGEAAVASMGAQNNINPIQLDITDDESIEHCFKTIEQLFGKLDILINNAGTAGKANGLDRKPREIYDEVFSVNVTSAALLTDAMTPLLEKSKNPKVIMITSGLGSIQRVLDQKSAPIPVPWYSASKSALNYLTVYYAKKFPEWKVNAVCPGYRATGLNSAELNDQTDPALGAVRAVQLALEGKDGVTGTYSHSDGTYPW